MKKTLTVLFFFFVSLAVFAGGKQAGESAGTADGVSIGIVKIVQHPALDAVEAGIKARIEERGITARYDLQNANGDLSTAAQIANKFKAGKLSATVGIGTPVAQALAKTIKDAPVVFATVTDPVGAGLVSSLSHGEGNITGMSDAIDTAAHIALFKEIAGIKTLGYIYTSSEANSASSLKLVEEAAKAQGLTLVTQSINNSAELRQAAQSIAGRVDGVYITTDNTVFSALPSLIQVLKDAKKPLFSGDVTGIVENGGGALIASGFNYYKAGLAAGDIVADIILKGAKPANIPVKFLTDPSESDFLLDLDVAAALRINVPQKYIDSANYIVQNGAVKQK